MKTNSRGVTLIELLVVAALISLLAGIGLVNLQEAQARAKVSRVESEMTSLCSAIEAYRTDCGAYPTAAEAGGDLLISTPLRVLTSPVAYVTAVPQDPFGEAGYDFAPELRETGYLYKDRATTSEGLAGETFGPIWRHQTTSMFFVHSCGPNRVWDVMPYAPYDPSNGTVSRGDIARFGP